MPTELKKKVRVVMHLPEGYCRVLIESTIGRGVHWDIPITVVPFHLRTLGSRFVVTATSVSGELEARNLTADEIRAACKFSVEEITDE